MTINPFSARRWKLAHNRSVELGNKAVIMGVLNVTPDSFSDGGQNVQIKSAIANTCAMVAAGATIVDIGGESTRPGATPIDADTEISRVLPIIQALIRETDVALSIDTYHAKTASAAIEAGVHILNDVWGLQKDPDMAGVVADTGAGVVIMHSGRGRTVLDDVIEDQQFYLGRSIDIAGNADISEDAIVLDPGIGFAKGIEENLALLNRFDELHQFGLPLLVGTSRKRFLGAITNRENPLERDVATAATSVVARVKGAAVFRVHDVAVNSDALKVADALLAANWKSKGITN